MILSSLKKLVWLPELGSWICVWCDRVVRTRVPKDNIYAVSMRKEDVK